MRIIPARAGFTNLLYQARQDGRDHPRSRGVYCFFDNAASRNAGSSPLARGLHLDDDSDPGVPGIIPARAGFTLRVGGDPRRF